MHTVLFQTADQPFLTNHQHTLYCFNRSVQPLDNRHNHLPSCCWAISLQIRTLLLLLSTLLSCSKKASSSRSSACTRITPNFSGPSRPPVLAHLRPPEHHLDKVWVDIHVRVPPGNVAVIPHSSRKGMQWYSHRVLRPPSWAVTVCLVTDTAAAVPATRAAALAAQHAQHDDSSSTARWQHSMHSTQAGHSLQQPADRQCCCCHLPHTAPLMPEKSKGQVHCDEYLAVGSTH